jgi:hypothetical protein
MADKRMASFGVKQLPLGKFWRNSALGVYVYCGINVQFSVICRSRRPDQRVDAIDRGGRRPLPSAGQHAVAGPPVGQYVASRTKPV